MGKGDGQGPGDSPEVYGYLFNGGNWEWLYSQMRSFGGWEYNEDGTESGAGAPEWLAWAQWALSMYKDGLTPHGETIPSGGLQSLLAARRAPMLEGPRGLYLSIKQAIEAAEKPFRWRVI